MSGAEQPGPGEALAVAVGQALYQWATNRRRIQALTETDTRRLHDGALLLVEVFIAHELRDLDTADENATEARYRGALAMWDALGAGDQGATARVLTEALLFNLNGPTTTQEASR